MGISTRVRARTRSETRLRHSPAWEDFRKGTGRRTKPPSKPSFSPLHEDADAGTRTRVTAATGPYDSRTTPRRLHGSRLGSIELPHSESNGPHPSPVGTPGLHAATATRAGNDVPAALGTLSAYWPHVHTAVGCERESKGREPRPAGPAANAGRTRHWNECRRQARVPLPRAGSPRGGRVMRAAMSGLRRSGSRQRG